MRFWNRYASYLAIASGLGACNHVDDPTEVTFAGGYQSVAYQLIMYDVIDSPPGTEFTLLLNPDSSFSGRLWFPAPWAPFWGDTSSYELLLSGTWEPGPGQLPSLPVHNLIPTDTGHGIYLHPSQPSLTRKVFRSSRPEKA